MARWGLQVKIHRTSFIKINFNPRVCFYNYFLHSFLYGPYARETDLDGAKILNNSTEKILDNFSPGIA
jgi:hypothetical protein